MSDDHAGAFSLQGAFSAEKERQLEQAQASSLMKRVVKLRYVEGGQYEHKGRAVEVDTFSVWESRKQLHNYGCSVAVSLHLSFTLE